MPMVSALQSIEARHIFHRFLPLLHNHVSDAPENDSSWYRKQVAWLCFYFIRFSRVKFLTHERGEMICGNKSKPFPQESIARELRAVAQ
mmetsp:Transcript_22893/g.35212  ORF Transcript_22893/g.35212 Transcript_22893/m.35212 type:complete len:89 (-) Transcript_22893:1187-1453(-)